MTAREHAQRRQRAALARELTDAGRFPSAAELFTIFPGPWQHESTDIDLDTDTSAVDWKIVADDGTTILEGRRTGDHDLGSESLLEGLLNAINGLWWVATRPEKGRTL